MIGRLLRYVNKIRRGVDRPAFQKTVSDYRGIDVGIDEQIVMSARQARDPFTAREKLKEKSAWELVKNVRINKKAHPLMRLRYWLMRMEGSYQSDPYATDFYRNRNPHDH